MEKVEAPARQRRYRTRPHAMGLLAGRNLDNIQELLAQLGLTIGAGLFREENAVMLIRANIRIEGMGGSARYEKATAERIAIGKDSTNQIVVDDRHCSART